MKTTVIILREPLRESIAKDIFSIASLISAIGIGIWLDSTALQWTAAVVWCLWMPIKALSYVQNSKSTIAEARAKLDQLEAGQ